MRVASIVLHQGMSKEAAMNHSTDKEQQSTEHNRSHAGSRSGLSDYNDGANVTHHLGNKENRKYDLSNQEDLENSLDRDDEVGRVANGNDLKEEDNKTTDT